VRLPRDADPKIGLADDDILPQRPYR
jgi:hypothetical protein